jgi:hypothetical protein
VNAAIKKLLNLLEEIIVYLVQKVRTLDLRNEDEPIEFFNVIDFGSKEEFLNAMSTIEAKKVYAGKKYVWIKKCDEVTTYFVSVDVETYNSELTRDTYDLKHGYPIGEILRMRLGRKI